jgi:hypothetical protein
VGGSHCGCSAREWLLARITEKPDRTLRAVMAELAERGTPASLRVARPFGQLPASRLKEWISDRAGKLWDGAVWAAQSYFDLPGAAIVRRVADFPYIRADEASFKAIAQLEEEVYETSVFLQGKLAGQPLTLAYWFEYDDEDLDLNSDENFVSWLLPEIVPSISSDVVVDAAMVQREVKALSAMPRDWRNDLTRSMERFTLSQCRHQTIDRVLDLTLAFEIAVSSKGDQAPQSWKVSVRAAQMIGGRLRDRQENRLKMVALYKLRNKGTHSSSLSGNQQSQGAVVTQAAALYRELLDSFWRHGGRTDWSAIELGPITTE